MKRTKFQNSFLYKFRVPSVFLLLAISAIFFATFNFAVWPAGISAPEINSATYSANFLTNFSFFSEKLIDAPWHFFQWLSVEFFGFHVWSLRLPALIFALFAAAIFVYLAKLYFGKKTALFAGIFLITNVGFLSIARQGGEISLLMLIFALTLLFLRKILAIDSVEIKEKSSRKLLAWLVAFALAIAAMFYFSGGIYLVIAIFLATVLHPTSRVHFFHNKKVFITFNSLVLLLISPILLTVFQGIFAGNFALLAKSFLIFNVDFLANLRDFGRVFFSLDFNFFGGMIAPIFSLAEIILAIFGLIYVAKNFRTTRDFLLISLLIFASLATILDAKFGGILLLVILLFVAQAISRLLLSWGELFPVNEYSRALALVLVAAISLVSGWINYERYFIALNYNENIVYEFDPEFAALDQEISRIKTASENNKIIAVVSEKNSEFYKNLAQKDEKVEIMTARDFAAEKLSTENVDEKNSVNSGVDSNEKREDSEFKSGKKSAADKIIILNSARVFSEKIPEKIVSDSRKKDAALLRIY